MSHSGHRRRRYNSPRLLIPTTKFSGIEKSDTNVFIGSRRHN
jgi:hypothetical protein